MFKNMKMAGKMTFGFGAVILLVVIVGGLAILNMLQIQEKSNLLNDAYVPEVGIANKLERHSLLTMYAMRGFSLSMDQSFAETGQAELALIQESLKEARELYEDFPVLVKLKEGVEQAEANVATYADLAGETAEVIRAIEQQRLAMDAAAGKYMKQAADYLTDQENKIVGQFSDDSSAAALEERLWKITLINNAIDLGNEARVTNFKGQAAMDGSIMTGAVELLDQASPILDDILAETTQQNNVRQLNAIEAARAEYREAVNETARAYQRLGELAKQRDAAAKQVLDSAQFIAEAGISTTQEMSQESVDKITRAVLMVIVGLIVALLVSVLLAFILTRMITKALKAGVTFAEEIAAGDLTVTLDVRQKDEIGQLADALRAMLKALQVKAAALERIADGDLTVDVVKASDRDGLGESMLVMKNSLSDIMSQVNAAVEQVNTGSNQVSQSSQVLSQGATEQAASLEEISSTVTEVNNQSRQNADNASEASNMAKQASENATKGNGQMVELKEAMTNINSSAEDIKKVVKVIDDIAFQINLLALNANVEAARAGKYGKGFAVVAEEVRNLAVRSAEAVKETSSMVEAVVENILGGNEISERTAEQLEEILNGSNKVAEFLQEITMASTEQAQAVSQISDALEQIDQVTQNNSASSEESAAAAEELASQAQQLRAMVSRFKLDAKYSNASYQNRYQNAGQNDSFGTPSGHGESGEMRNPNQRSIPDNTSQNSGSSVQGVGVRDEQDPREVIKLDDSDFEDF